MHGIYCEDAFYFGWSLVFEGGKLDDSCVEEKHGDIDVFELVGDSALVVLNSAHGGKVCYEVHGFYLFGAYR